tara:strand:- start:114 stop:302 length:189 start_codon:yes stop_codon:yes gene_type:complete
VGKEIKMAKELYCPECGTEYWGSIENAKCNECNYVYTELEIKLNPTRSDLAKYNREKLSLKE